MPLTYFSAMEEEGDHSYDPEAGLLWAREAKSSVHVSPSSTPRHAVRESLYYALVLFESGQPERVERARTLVERVIGLQETSDPESPRYGLWHYFAEESVLEWTFPDFNWADFNAMALLLIHHTQGRHLTGPLNDAIREAVRRAALCVRRRNVDVNYTNIAVKGTFVTLAAAELLGDADLLSYARDRMRRVHAAIFSTDSVAEYNSPTYAGVCLGAVMEVENFVLDAGCRALALEIEHRLWLTLARHFHAASGELAGPHSRAYTTTIADSPALLGSLIEKATEGSVRYSVQKRDREPFDAIYGHFLKPDVPAAALALLRDDGRREELREVAQRFPEGSAARTTTYIAPRFSVGTVNFQDGWEQRQNLIAYWPLASGGAGRKTGWLRHRYLHDARPCCSGFFAAAQREGTILAGSFVGDFADHHVSFPVSGVRASFLGPVIEADFGGEPFEVMAGGRAVAHDGEIDLEVGTEVRLRSSGLDIVFRLLGHGGGGGETFSPRLVRRTGGVGIEMPHYRGPEREWQWADFAGAHTFYGLAIVPQDAAAPFERGEVVREGEAWIARWQGLTVSTPATVLGLFGIRAFYAETQE